MTSLPINSNNPQSPTMASPGGVPPSRNDPSAASGDTASTSQKNGAVNDQAAEAFSALLARQIADAGLASLDTAQFSATINGKIKAADNTNLTAKDAQDHAIIAANASSDPVGSLAAILLQIPLQHTDTPSKSAQVVDALQLRGASSADKGQSALTKSGIKQKTEDSISQTSSKSTGTDSGLPATDYTDSSPLIHLATDTVKHVAIALSSAAQPQVGQNNAKAVMSETASAVMPNVLSKDIPADIPQTITAPLGGGGWADEFSQKIVWMSTQQNQIAELHLNPPDLGPLNVVLKISDNQLTAQFSSPHSAVRDAVENALPKLREILADNNISLGNATVSDQAPRDRGAEGFMNQGSKTAQQRDASIATGSNELSPTTAQSIPARRHNGMLDTFA